MGEPEGTGGRVAAEDREAVRRTHAQEHARGRTPRPSIGLGFRLRIVGSGHRHPMYLPEEPQPTNSCQFFLEAHPVFRVGEVPRGAKGEAVQQPRYAAQHLRRRVHIERVPPVTPFRYP